MQTPPVYSTHISTPMLHQILVAEQYESQLIGMLGEEDPAFFRGLGELGLSQNVKVIETQRGIISAGGGPNMVAVTVQVPNTTTLALLMYHWGRRELRLQLRDGWQDDIGQSLR